MPKTKKTPDPVVNPIPEANQSVFRSRIASRLGIRRNNVENHRPKSYAEDSNVNFPSDMRSGSDDLSNQFNCLSRAKQELIRDLIGGLQEEHVPAVRAAWERLQRKAKAPAHVAASGAGGVAALPRVKDDPAFRAHAAVHQWESRRERGLPWRMDVFEFIRDTYTRWLGHGLMRSDLRAVDKPLWVALCKRLKTDALPSWLPLPTEAEAKLDSIQNQTSQKLMQNARVLWREADRLKRQALSKG